MLAAGDSLGPVERLQVEKRQRAQTAALLDSQTQVARLRSRLIVADRQHEEQRLSDTEQLEQARRTAAAAEQKCAAAAAETGRLRTRCQDLEDQLSELRAQLEQSRLAADRRCLEQQREADQRQQQLQQALQAVQQERDAAQRERDAAVRERDAAACGTSEVQPGDGSGSADQERLRETEDQLRAARLRIHQLENRLISGQEDVKVAELMRQRLRDWPGLERENTAMRAELRSLRHLVDRTAALEEQASVLQSKADRFCELQQQVADSEQRCSGLHTELEQWRRAPGQEITSPDQLRHVLTDLRRQQLLLQQRAAEATAQLGRAEAECDKLRQQVQQLTSERDRADGAAAEAQLQLGKLQRRLTLVTMERDSSKAILDAYEAETTSSLTSIERQRLEGVRRRLEASQQQVEQLERQLQQAAQSGRLLVGSCSGEQQQLEQLRTELRQQQEQNRRLEEQRAGLEAQLEDRALRGDYNPASTRVLSLRENPASAAGSRRAGELERLRQENSQLRAAQAQSGHTTDPQLRAQLRAAELRCKRLKEVFGRSTQEFRKSVSLLTGYKINADGERLRLRSVYSAPDEEQTLLFQKGDGDTISLLETQYSASLQELVQRYLWRRDSIPGFLAALTLRQLESGSDTEPSESEPDPDPDGPPPQDADSSEPEVVELD